ncbi:MAG: EF-hand domain-containing protein [Thermoguttaceae bacterium]|nr:EF-hand domain-containing protein [Thermoguttaceae bacterium]MDW8038984.1 EF-hand domain-containing protein [Thermoguttaceae bacterium]
MRTACQMMPWPPTKQLPPQKKGASIPTTRGTRKSSLSHVLIGLLLLLGVSLVVSTALVAQLQAQERSGRGRWRERRPPEGMPQDPASRLRFRLERAERLISSFDANQDGVIEPNEVQGQSRYIYERMAKEAGLNPMHSIAVAEFRAAVIRHIQQTEQQQQSKSPPGGPTPSGGPPPGLGSTTGSGPVGSSGMGPSLGGLRGFGAQTPNLPKPAGFGLPGTSSGSSLSSSPSAPPPSSPERQELERRVREYAQSLFRQYDANKNGILEREEWQQMRGSPEKADRNNDGRITLEELTHRELERNQLALSGSSSSTSSSGSSGSSSSGSGSGPGTSSTWTSSSLSSSSSSGSSSRPSGSGSTWSGSPRSSSSSSRSSQPVRVRFLTPLERLPKGIPDWFIQKDADGDGQVSMAEFASEWTDAKAAEFQKYDLNNDGLITPQECLRAEKAKSF